MRFRRPLAAFSAILSAISCDSPLGSDGDVRLAIVSGGVQVSVPRGQAPFPLVVEAGDRWNHVRFEGDAGSMFDRMGWDGNGKVWVHWSIDRGPGTYHATARIEGGPAVHFVLHLTTAASVTVEPANLRFNSLRQQLPLRLRFRAGDIDALLEPTNVLDLVNVELVRNQGRIDGLRAVSNGEQSAAAVFGFREIPFDITVRQVPHSRRVMLDGDSILLGALVTGPGAASTLRVRWVDSLGYAIADSADGSATWSSTNPSVITVDGAGGVGIGADGEATLAVSGTLSATVPALVWSFDAEQVATNGHQTCVVGASGSLACWGAPGILHTPLGVLTVPTRLRTHERFASVSLGSSSACGIRADGTTSCWGAGTFGQLAAAQSTGLTFSSLSSGDGYHCGLLADSTAWCWGLDYLGALGDGNVTSGPCAPQTCTLVPVPVSGSHKFSAIDVGERHACALDSAGAAWCWGSNYNGETADTTYTTAAPMQVPGLPRLTGIAAGKGHSCGVAADGSAWCWGSNYRGALGAGLAEDAGGRTPVRVSGAVQFASIAAGGERTCALTASGEAWCWGALWFKPQANPAPAIIPPPAPPPPPQRNPCDEGMCSGAPVPVGGNITFRSLALAERLTCGISVAGVAYCLGGGVLGDGSRAENLRDVPRRVLYQRRSDP